MKIKVSVQSFDNPQFNFLIPSIDNAMKNAIIQLADLEELHINISKLNTIHITEDYQNELFSFQQQIGHTTFVTNNEIAKGVAQVINVKTTDCTTEDLIGYHIFMDKCIPMILLLSEYSLDTQNGIQLSDEEIDQIKENKLDYLIKVRHELAHIEDLTNQENLLWIPKIYQDLSVNGQLRCQALHLWREYYACQRSIFNHNAKILAENLNELFVNLEKAEKEICELRWKYNTQLITLESFVKKLYDYIYTAYVYCCYSAGHLDIIYNNFFEDHQIDSKPSRFLSYFPKLWKALRNLRDMYPNWSGAEIFDEIASILLATIKSFEVYPLDTPDGIYFSIPPKKLNLKSGENN